MANEYVRKTILGNVPATSLNAGIDNAVIALVLASAAGWPADGTIASAPMVIAVDLGAPNEEKMLVTAKAGTTLTVQRGYDNTLPVVHAAGAVIAHVLDAHTVDQANRLANLLEEVGQLLGFNGVNPVPVAAPTSDGEVLLADSGSASGVTWTAWPDVVADASAPNVATTIYDLWIDLTLSVLRFADAGEWKIPKAMLEFLSDATRTFALGDPPPGGLFSIVSDSDTPAYSHGGEWVPIATRAWATANFPTVTVSASPPAGPAVGDIWLEPVV